jgi:hypothetical protein
VFDISELMTGSEIQKNILISSSNRRREWLHAGLHSVELVYLIVLFFISSKINAEMSMLAVDSFYLEMKKAASQ